VTRLATVAIHKDELNFSAGHFTIFSATEREDLHGHNYYVDVTFDVLLNDNGLAFDYRVYKRKLKAICEKLDRRFLLPSQSLYLTLEETEDMWIGHYNQEKIPFLKRDAVILPLCNITIEELSNWFLQQLVEDKVELEKNNIQGIRVRVFNGPGQSGGVRWDR